MVKTMSYTCVDLSSKIHDDQFAKDVKTGLLADNRYLPQKYTYDARGSKLFEKITQSDYYYIAKTEEAILRDNATDILNTFSSDLALIELGSGSAVKTQYLIESLLKQQRKATFLPIDISKDFLFKHIEKLSQQHQELHVIGVAANYEVGLAALEKYIQQPKLIIWLGSDIGQLNYVQAAEFLKKNIVNVLNPEDKLLLGLDLKKNIDLLHKAYSCKEYPDETHSAFTLNILLRINQELEGDFDINAFQRQGYYDEEAGCVRIYLTCLEAQQHVTIKAIDLALDFFPGDRINLHTAYKYDQSDIQNLAQASGLCLKNQWFDQDHLFSMNLFSKP